MSVQVEQQAAQQVVLTEAEDAIASAQAAMRVATTPSAARAAVKVAEIALTAARRARIPDQQLRVLQNALTRLKGDATARVAEAQVRDRRHAELALRGGNRALAAVFERRATTSHASNAVQSDRSRTVITGTKSQAENSETGGLVIFTAKSHFTIAEIEQMSRYVETAKLAMDGNRLSSSGRVATSGMLRAASSLAAARERRRAEAAGVPYEGQVGHAPDATWTGRPKSGAWHDQTARVNASLGAQSRAYPIGFKPTDFSLGYNWQAR
jgi:hypothetical protein